MPADLISEKVMSSGSSPASSHTTTATEHANVFTPAVSNNNSSATGDHSLLEEHLYPDDSYTKDGVYWADLKGRDLRQFVNSTSNIEAKREIKVSREIAGTEACRSEGHQCSSRLCEQSGRDSG